MTVDTLRIIQILTAGKVQRGKAAVHEDILQSHPLHPQIQTWHCADWHLKLLNYFIIKWLTILYKFISTKKIFTETQTIFLARK